MKSKLFKTMLFIAVLSANAVFSMNAPYIAGSPPMQPEVIEIRTR